VVVLDAAIANHVLIYKAAAAVSTTALEVLAVAD
jgi:hypothetical protein